jgi:hypothetical protein
MKVDLTEVDQNPIPTKDCEPQRPGGLTMEITKVKEDELNGRH